MKTSWIITVATMALAGAAARAQEPTTKPSAAERVTRIENNIKHARDDYQRALAGAVAALENERELAIAAGDRERATGHIAELIVKLKGPLIASGAFVDRDLDSLFTPSKEPDAPRGLVHLVYDWSSADQFADWRTEGPAAASVKENPKLLAGALVFQGHGARLKFLKRLAVRSVRLEVEAVDSFQAMNITIGGGPGFRLHFSGSYISDLPGEATKVSVNLQKQVVIANIDISSEGHAVLTVGDARVSRDGVAPGELCISIDQPGPVRIKSIVIEGTAP